MVTKKDINNEIKKAFRKATNRGYLPHVFPEMQRFQERYLIYAPQVLGTDYHLGLDISITSSSSARNIHLNLNLLDSEDKVLEKLVTVSNTGEFKIHQFDKQDPFLKLD